MLFVANYNFRGAMDGWMDEPAVELPVTGFILFVGPVTNLR